MAKISVSEAAERLGVGVQRVHQRIADGSLPAERIGSRYAIEEADLLPLRDVAHRPGRPHSERSALALLAVSEPDPAHHKRLLQAIAELADADYSPLAPAERSVARKRLRHLVWQPSVAGSGAEKQRQLCAAALRKSLARRADRRLYRAAPPDLVDMRNDARLRMAGVSLPESGLASGNVVEAYVDRDLLEDIVRHYLLDEASSSDANVILHIAPKALSKIIRLESGSDSQAFFSLLLAADLAEHRDPRSERRAVELLDQVRELLSNTAGNAT